MNGRYVITLKNCAFFSTHGVMEEEERKAFGADSK